MAREQDAEAAPAICARCSMQLQTGTGSYFNIAIEAVADPTPPVITADDMKRDLRRDIRQLIAQLESTSAQEAMDQVYRRLTIAMCNDCYQEWIENPAG